MYGIVLMMLIIHSGFAASGDNYEPNDTRETSHEIILSDGIWKSESASLSSAGDVDWYSFTGESGDYISISCNLIDEYDIAFSLYYGDMKLTDVDSYYSGMGEKTEKYPLGDTGTYYIAVGTPEKLTKLSHTAVGSDTYGAYSLEITVYKKHTVTGKVTDAKTGAAIISAQVVVEQDDSYTTETDNDGMFAVVLEGTRSGDKFSVQVQKSGYIADVVEGLTSGESVTDIAVELTPLKDDTRNVLLEEFTGTRCLWCPYANEILEDILANQSNIILIAYHIDDEMSIQDVTQLGKLLNPALPQALIDRTQFTDNNSILLDRQVWTKRCIERSGDSTPLSITIEHDYMASSRLCDVTVDIYTNTEMGGDYRINLVVCEDSLNYRQYITGQDYKTIYPYYHMHVVRRMITGAFGERLNEVTIPAQTYIQKDFSFALDESVDENHASLVVFVHENLKDGFGPVQQAAKCTVVGSSSSHADVKEKVALQLHPSYPNPFNETTMIPFTLPEKSYITLTIYNIIGEKVTTLVDGVRQSGSHALMWDAKGYSSGIYLYRLQSNRHIKTGKMILMK